MNDGTDDFQKEFLITISAITNESIPTISLIGDSIVFIDNGATLTDPGYSASDDIDGDITDNVSVDYNTIDTDTAGYYLIHYNVSDSAGNSAVEVTRMVIVKKPDEISTLPIDSRLWAGASERAYIEDVILPE